MTWHMPVLTRLAFGLVAVAIAAGGVALIVDDAHATVRPGGIVLGFVMLAVAAYPAALGWRTSVTVDGNELTIQSAIRAKNIKRNEITEVEADDSSVSIRYTRDGDAHTATSDAAQGYFNFLGAKLAKRTTRTQQIAASLKDWQRGTP